MTVAELTEALDRSQERYLADECEAFEGLLKAELRAFVSLENNRERWEEAVHAGSLNFDFHTDKNLTSRYRNWVFNARICLQQLELQEEKGCYPVSLEEFRECLEKAEGILLTRTQDEAAAESVLLDV